MVRVFGYSDDCVGIEGSCYSEREIGCFDHDVRIMFDDGSVILVGYDRKQDGIWRITVEHPGEKTWKFTYCNDADAEIYSDIFETEAEVVQHEVIDRINPTVRTGEIPFEQLSILPPRPGVCPVCATPHDPALMHNRDSLYYQMRFRQKHGRTPTWADAAAHCTPEVKAQYAPEFARLGISFDAGDSDDGKA